MERCLGRTGASQMAGPTDVADFDRLGVCLIAGAVAGDHLPALRAALDETMTKGPGNRIFALPSPGRDDLDLGVLFADLADRLAGRPARLVRILAFDKTPAANWGVPWHQDRTIAVKRRVEVDGFGPWSVKGGMPHVEPPQSLLERMFSLRLHLDDCGDDNGPLKVIPNSHRLGRLPVREVLDLGARSPAVTCTAMAGDVLAMKALTVHASDPAGVPAHRRVLHVDFTTAELPSPLAWAVVADPAA